MGRRPATEQRDTLYDIRHVAFGLFGRYGYDGVSMLAVARAAGVTKAALYWHFDGKQALYAECMRQLNAIFKQHVFDHMQKHNGPMERLTAVFRGMGAMLEDPRVQQGVAGYWLQPSTADVSEALAEQAQFEQGSARLVAQTIQQAVNAGDLKLSIPVSDMADAVIATMEAIVLPLRRNTLERSQRTIDVLAHTFFKAHAEGEALNHASIYSTGRTNQPTALAS